MLDKVAIVDRREPLTRVAQLRYEGFEIEVPADLLESGDVVLVIDGKQIGIEVKTTSELLSLIPSGLSQLAQFQRMATFDQRVLLIVGTYGVHAEGKVLVDGWNKRSGLTYAAVEGALFNLQANLGFLIRHAGQEKNVGRCVQNIYEYFSESHTLLMKPRPLTLSSEMAGGLAMLMTLPGIGADKAEAILKQYQSLQSALCDTAHWSSIPGIGPKTVDVVAAFLTKGWASGS
jgi:ERCC4-type nuclease